MYKGQDLTTSAVVELVMVVFFFLIFIPFSYGGQSPGSHRTRNDGMVKQNLHKLQEKNK